MATLKQKAILVIFDGFGISTQQEGNAIRLAHTPNFDKLLQDYPHSQIQTSGEAVGLPQGQMGNSEIGHLNIGSGRVIYSDIVKISMQLQNGEFARNPAFLKLLDYTQNHGKRIHFLGLLSNGGVHSLQEHLQQILRETQKQAPQSQCFVHAFLDGRDTAPDSGKGFVKQLNNFCKQEVPSASLATVIGRYYAMDRDNRWDRVERAYNLLTEGEGKAIENVDNLQQTMQDFYDQGITDEFMEPILVNAQGLIQDGDAILLFNFRADRVREITSALTLADFSSFKRKKFPQTFCATMTEYKKEFTTPVLYPPEKLQHLLSEVVSQNGLTQLHTAETEKYAHVTFFFNGGREEPFAGEERMLVPSPKVKTYDLQPSMSAYTVKDNVLAALEKGYDFIVVNFANGDMVGHTGVLRAAIESVETLDICLGEITAKVLEKNYSMLLTADHGNCEQMFADDGKSPFTQHTTNPVWLLWVDKTAYQNNKHIKNGKLADLAPTLLHLMGLPIPRGADGMSGEVLV